MTGNILSIVSAPQFVLFYIFLSVATITFFVLKKREKTGIRYGSGHDLAKAKLLARNLTFGLLSASIVIIISLGFVLANGSSESISSGECKDKDPNRRDTMIVVDISGSMIDTSGTNFKLMRSTLLRTLSANFEENMGLTFFSTAAFAPIAPTKCHAVFVTLVHEDLYKSFIFKDFVAGTDGSAGINVARRLLAQSNAKTKRIVFIGDLDDNDQELFMRTLKEAQENDIQELEILGIKTSLYEYQQMEAYGFDVTLIKDELDAEKIGPLPRDLNNIEEVSFSSQLEEPQLIVGRIVLGAVIGIIILNFYVRRQIILRRNK